MDDSTRLLLVRRVLGETWGARSAVEWAIEQLENGRETESILMLAGLSKSGSDWEADDYFQRSLRELGWSVPAREELLRWYADFTACRIIEEPTAPVERLAAHVRGLSELAFMWPKGDLDVWVRVHGDYECMTAINLSEEAWRSDVLAQARALLAHDADR